MIPLKPKAKKLLLNYIAKRKNDIYPYRFQTFGKYRWFFWGVKFDGLNDKTYQAIIDIQRDQDAKL